MIRVCKYCGREYNTEKGESQTNCEEKYDVKRRTNNRKRSTKVRK